jgi:prepilin-type N-terminal cleavage/methylation domain-containing protein
MKIRTNNKGLSLVEMMVSIAILSVVMIGVFGILAAMSKSFSISQKEVQLQDSVQNTYSIVSDIIKEAQTGSNSSIQSVQFDSANHKAYIIDDDTNDWTQSKFYIVELDTSTHILYLYSDSLYATATVTVTPVPTVSENGDGEDDSSATPMPTTTPATKTEKGSMVDYKSISVKSLADKDSYLLSKNVKTFSVDVSSYGDGYVVVGLELEYGTRTASITQNVYLRNSNNSVLASGSTGTTPTPSGLEGYKLDSITSVTVNKSFSVGDTPKASDFTVTAKYASETDSTDVKTATLTSYECDKFGTPFSTTGDVNLTFTAKEDSSITYVQKVNVTDGILSIENGGLFELDAKNTISTHADLNTYFSVTSKDSTKAVSSVTCTLPDNTYTCQNTLYTYTCGGNIYKYRCSNLIDTYVCINKLYVCKATVNKKRYICNYCGKEGYDWGHNCQEADGNNYDHSTTAESYTEECGSTLVPDASGNIKCNNDQCSLANQERNLNDAISNGTAAESTCNAVLSYDSSGKIQGCSNSNCSYRDKERYISDTATVKKTSVECGQYLTILDTGKVQNGCDNQSCSMRGFDRYAADGDSAKVKKVSIGTCGKVLSLSGNSKLNPCYNGCEYDSVSRSITDSSVVKTATANVCGSSLSLDVSTGKVNGCNNSLCEYYNVKRLTTDSTVKAEAKLDGSGNQATVTATINVNSTGKGTFSIVNDSDETDYTNVTVVIYFTNDNTGFIPLSGKNYLTLNSEATNGTQKVTYYVEGAAEKGYTEYLKIVIPSMPKGDASKDIYTTYTFNFAWASGNDLDTSKMAMAVYSEDAN